VSGLKIHLDDDELRRLEVDLSGAPLRAQWNLTNGVRRGAAIVDKGMRVDASGHKGNWFGLPGTSYDTPLEQHVSHEMLSPDTAEIGIENKGAGKLAHIIVFGSVNNAPVYDHMSGPRRAMPRVVSAMADQAEDDVLGGPK
jgi:hypothetical protein